MSPSSRSIGLSIALTVRTVGWLVARRPRAETASAGEDVTRPTLRSHPRDFQRALTAGAPDANFEDAAKSICRAKCSSARTRMRRGSRRAAVCEPSECRGRHPAAIWHPTGTSPGAASVPRYQVVGLDDDPPFTLTCCGSLKALGITGGAALAGTRCGIEARLGGLYCRGARIVHPPRL